MRKKILITGGTKGIGRAVAECFVTSGYDVLLTYASDDKHARGVAEKLRSINAQSQIDVLKADITRKESINTIHTYLQTHSIKLFSVVFNAGITYREPFETMTLSEWEKIFFAHIHFPVFLIQRILPQIEKEGSVLFTGSMMGEYPHGTSLSYGVSKSAVHALVKNLVKFLAPYGVRVNAVAPGFVETEWQKNKPAEIKKNIESKLACGRFASPQEVAQTFKLLLENDYFNGEVIQMSGGYDYR